MKNVTSIFEKLYLEDMITNQQMESNKKTEEVLKRVDELKKIGKSFERREV